MAALLAVAERDPDAPAIGWFEHGEKRTRSYAELVSSVQRLAHALVAERLLPSETAVVMAPAGPSWFLAHHAVLAAGGVVVPIDEASGAEETAGIIRETEARVVLVAGARARATVERIRARLPFLRTVVVLDDDVDDPTAGALAADLDPSHDASHDAAPTPPRDRTADRWRERPVSLALSRLERTPYDLATAAEARRRAQAWSGDDVAAVHYLPAASGRMNGAVVTHAQTMYPARAIRAVVDIPDRPSIVVTLPITQPVQYWACLVVLASGGTIWCPDPGQDLPGLLREVRPSVAVTTVGALEALLADVAEDLRTRRAVSPELLERALRAATRARELAADDQPVPSPLALAARAAQVRVVRPLVARLGGPRALTLVGGQSMPRPELMAVLKLLEQAPQTGWGARETCAVTTLNTPTANRRGSVGRPLPGTEIRIADDGEVLVRGPGVMLGYYGRPAETRAALVDGWLHSGQHGRLDDDGYLYLTSRVDDIILSSSLVYTSARPLEARLEADPLIADAVVVGEARPWLTVLIHPDLAALSAAVGPDAPDDDGLLVDPRAVRLVGDVVRRLGQEEPPQARVRAFRLVASPLGSPLPPSDASMTRRQRAVQDHADLIEDMYADLAASRPTTRPTT